MAFGYVSLQILTAQWPVSIQAVLERRKNPSKTDERFTLAKNILTFRLYRRCLMCSSLTWLTMLKRDFSWQGSIAYFSVWGGFPGLWQEYTSAVCPKQNWACLSGFSLRTHPCGRSHTCMCVIKSALTSAFADFDFSFPPIKHTLRTCLCLCLPLLTSVCHGDGIYHL